MFLEVAFAKIESILFIYLPEFLLRIYMNVCGIGTNVEFGFLLQQVQKCFLSTPILK